MALTDQNTVLILGAGVSVPFGLPTGVNLIDDIARNLEKQLSDFFDPKRHYFSDSPLYPTNSHDTFLRFPYLQPLLWEIGAINADGRVQNGDPDFSSKLHQKISEMKELVALLENQTSDSIDDFIVLNPTYSKHVKICIAAEFIKALYEKENNNRSAFVLREIDGRHLKNKPSDRDKGERNWIHRLINLVRLGVTQGTISEGNKIQILTFNYDTILEYVLKKQFSNFEGGTSEFGDYDQYVEIIHVHGQCGPLNVKMPVPAKTCWEWAGGIKVIREDADQLGSEVQIARSRAIEIISNAAEIYACGFAFAKANTDLISLIPKTHHDRKISYCNFSGDIGLKNAVEKFRHHHKTKSHIKHTQVFEQTGIGAADWIGIGTLGELP